MNYGFIFGLVGTVIAIGSVLVGIVTRFKHIEHILSDIRDIKESIEKIEIQVKEHGEHIAYMKGKTNGVR